MYARHTTCRLVGHIGVPDQYQRHKNGFPFFWISMVLVAGQVTCMPDISVESNYYPGSHTDSKRRSPASAVSNNDVTHGIGKAARNIVNSFPEQEPCPRLGHQTRHRYSRTSQKGTGYADFQRLLVPALEAVNQTLSTTSTSHNPGTCRTIPKKIDSTI
jgi:hypothetical protein